jgi:hypothetical protein
MATGIYHATAIPLSKWARDKINRIARNFIWAGDDAEHAAKGKALVNWKTVCKPKGLGGLGMPDLERTGRALRLRWPWLNWTKPERPWAGSQLPCDEKDMSLFRASTRIDIGDGETASFWHDNWCTRGPLAAWAPDLFAIATRKNRSVAKEISDNNWIRSVARINSPTQLTQYLEIWDIVQTIFLDPSRPDSISWLLTTDGNYSASSAYKAQFLGSHPSFAAQKIWSAHAEPKCKLFAWLALHGKLLTADMLAIRGWTHDPVCPLCRRAPETAVHLCKDCPFTVALWNMAKSWDNDVSADTRSSFISISDWWDDMLTGKPRNEQRRISGRFLYVVWNAWKERNRRIFTGLRLTYPEVADLAREDITQRQRAFTTSGQAFPPEPD